MINRKLWKLGGQISNRLFEKKPAKILFIWLCL
jgi:hypothetical protein